MATLTVTRLDADRYSLQSDIAMTDGSYLGEPSCRLAGGMLKAEALPKGVTRVAPGLTLRVSDERAQLLQALAVGACLTFNVNR